MMSHFEKTFYLSFTKSRAHTGLIQIKMKTHSTTFSVDIPHRISTKHPDGET